MCAYLPLTLDGKGHGNPEIQENTVLADPAEKDPINDVEHIQISHNM